MLDFTYPALLLLLWPALFLPGLWGVVRRRSERQLAGFIATQAQRHGRAPASRRGTTARAWLVTGALCLLVMAAADPTSLEHDAVAETMEHDMVILLDVSRSMRATDVKPDRLEQARGQLLRIVERIASHRIALVTFRGGASLACPLTRDRDFLRQALATAGMQSAPAGATDIGSGLRLATRLLSGPSGGGTILLASDGEDLAGAVAPALDRAAGQGIRCITLGAGTRAGGRIPSPDTESGFIMRGGSPVITRRQDNLLRRIAARGGAYIPLAPEQRLTDPAAACFEVLRGISYARRETLDRRRHHHYPGLLLPAILLLLVAAWPPGEPLRHRLSAARAAEKRRRRIAPLWGMLFGCFVFSSRAAVPAAGSAPSPFHVQFNAAARSFHAGNYEQAIARLAALAPATEEQRTRLRMARGCALYRHATITANREPVPPEARVALLQDAAETFRDVLRRDPKNTVAATNLTVVVLAFRKLAARLPPEDAAAHPSAPPPGPLQATPPEKEKKTAARDEPQTTPSAGPTPGEPVPSNDEPTVLSEDQVESILDRALLREERYRSEKSRRRDAPLPPGSRDW